jgi:hypothetical protein
MLLISIHPPETHERIQKESANHRPVLRSDPHSVLSLSLDSGCRVRTGIGPSYPVCMSYDRLEPCGSLL